MQMRARFRAFCCYLQAELGLQPTVLICYFLAAGSNPDGRLHVRNLAILTCAVLAMGIAPGSSLQAQTLGAEVYQKYCAACHDHPTDRVPPRATLQKLSKARILKTLDFGLMMSVAYPMRRDEREAVAEFSGDDGGRGEASRQRVLCRRTCAARRPGSG